MVCSIEETAGWCIRSCGTWKRLNDTYGLETEMDSWCGGPQPDE